VTNEEGYGLSGNCLTAPPLSPFGPSLFHVSAVPASIGYRVTAPVTIGRATLYCGDCREVLPSLAPVDSVIADLPYGTTQNKWDSALPLDWLWAMYRKVCGGPIVLTCQGAFTARLILSNEAAFKYKIVWEKSKPTNFLNAKKQPLRKHEDICVFQGGTYNPQMQPGKAYSKGVRKDQRTGSYGDFAPVLVASDGGRYPTDVIYFPTAESEGPVVHPTQKPLRLMDYLVRTYSHSGDMILDNAMGSGSTGVAAVMAGRRFVGIESDPKYFALACERLRAAQIEQAA
jgi:site-specific DNA-methyltransferase (adenine-specific)/modification methylase